MSSACAIIEYWHVRYITFRSSIVCKVVSFKTNKLSFERVSFDVLFHKMFLLVLFRSEIEHFDLMDSYIFY